MFWAAPFWRVGRERGNKLFIPAGLMQMNLASRMSSPSQSASEPSFTKKTK